MLCNITLYMIQYKNYIRIYLSQSIVLKITCALFFDLILNLLIIRHNRIMYTTRIPPILRSQCSIVRLSHSNYLRSVVQNTDIDLEYRGFDTDD